MATITATPSATARPMPSASPSPAAQPLQILAAKLAPSPWTGAGPLTLWLNLSAPCQRVQLKVYSPARVLALDWQGPARGAGWQSCALPAASVATLGSGLWHFQVWVEEGERRSAPRHGSFYVVKRQ